MDFTAIIITCMISFALFQGSSASVLNGSYVSYERELYDYLMSGYRSSIRPVNRQNETLTVDINMQFTNLEDLDERSQTMISSGWLKQTWKDVELSWDPANFGGVTDIRIPISELWYPDITIMNSKDAYFSFPLNYLALVLSSGDVLWVPPVNFMTHCNLDLSHFPFDEHTCPIIFTSWTYDDTKVNVTCKDVGNHYDISGFDQMALMTDQQPEWDVTTVTVERYEPTFPCCPGQVYPQIVFKLTLKRRSSFVTNLFVAPSVILCILTPFIFLLPAGSGEKIMLGVGVLVSDVLLLGELINYVPSAHPNLPLIAKYFLGNIVMTCLSLAVSALVINLSDRSNSRNVGPSAFIRLFLLGPVARFLCVQKDQYDPVEDVPMQGSGRTTTEDMNPDAEDASGDGFERRQSDQRRRNMTKYLRNAAMSEWRLVAVVCDRLFFLVYCVILAIMTLAFTRYL